MTAPVNALARKPAKDLRGASGSRRKGMRGMIGMERGRGGVYAPQRRPMVEAAVSAQERL